jgi:glycosyltransferase involved in cell wall biosynthesis
MVFLESLANELPVVSTNHGGIPEAVEHGQSGLLVPEGDVPSLASALARVLASRELRASMACAGRQRTIEDFDVAKQTEKLEEIYDEVSGRRRRRRGIPSDG